VFFARFPLSGTVITEEDEKKIPPVEHNEASFVNCPIDKHTIYSEAQQGAERT
jgi:hypothetical protein